MQDTPELTPLDPLAWVRENPGMIFRAKRFTPVEAALLIAAGPLANGSRDVRVTRHDGWWIVAADQDWLTPPLDTAVFERLVPQPEAGPNSLYWEIVLTVHASDLLTATAAQVVVVKGGGRPPPLDVLLPGRAARSVAFKA